MGVAGDVESAGAFSFVSFVSFVCAHHGDRARALLECTIQQEKNLS